MTEIERSALVMHSAEKMFDLVNDVASYPQFLPGCRGAEVLFSSERTLEARLDLQRAGLRQSFVTRNQLERPHRMALTLVEGPFQAFNGEWRFTPLAEDACKVSFSLSFSLKNRLVAAAVGKLFSDLANQMVGVMCARADQVYGKQL
ncbi:type II toxin-antitoxin system RatA family toxin [Microbulbifer thermotolerans]|uniref:Type II toxin-antitoxin system RatA family toxin n=1 Tax=Microbulbifer thermotolerans TaxID=252514 RepID=A0A143HJ84_MICTH|nr:type II toxin-antitoxin system RatA family toxin [Microbulbifer thermotolerans]AMX01784.1 ubiquinone-binding protein [Microbulbifer thermotolerans]MCX2779559.1 type II toxin-antitoxin system RatA family toxin [Microbulbifer thermotolerans]MCX2783396.1 type II toxin-antitoxin system RatA family toxin [Microbulbifer thermotolerans]MCX2793431.1 type II toxin-antitoxin system RatA family toxin [Microbulbifer thermotolerans]MCX2802918.1 type II toxin-antitoxin system RatA family toxin [Microbulb